MSKSKISKNRLTPKSKVNPKLKLAKQKWQEAEKKAIAITKKGKQQLKAFEVTLNVRIQKTKQKAAALLKALEQLQKSETSSTLKGKKAKKSKAAVKTSTTTKKMKPKKIAELTKAIPVKKKSLKKGGKKKIAKKSTKTNSAIASPFILSHTK